MRRIVYWVMSTLTVVVLLLTYPTSRNATAVTAETRPGALPTASSSGSNGSGSSDSSGASGASSASGSSSSSRSGGSSGSGSSSGASASGSSATRSVTGEAVMTRYGNVQVQITVSKGKITAANVTQVPMEDRHDQMINSQAVPVYNDEAVKAQSAHIDVVSGATYTWEGYTQSLQSAIDRAHL